MLDDLAGPDRAVAQYARDLLAVVWMMLARDLIWPESIVEPDLLAHARIIGPLAWAVVLWGRTCCWRAVVWRGCGFSCCRGRGTPHGAPGWGCSARSWPGSCCLPGGDGLTMLVLLLGMLVICSLSGSGGRGAGLCGMGAYGGVHRPVELDAGAGRTGLPAGRGHGGGVGLLGVQMLHVPASGRERSGLRLAGGLACVTVLAQILTHGVGTWRSISWSWPRSAPCCVESGGMYRTWAGGAVRGAGLRAGWYHAAGRACGQHAGHDGGHCGDGGPECRTGRHAAHGDGPVMMGLPLYGSLLAGWMAVSVMALLATGAPVALRVLLAALLLVLCGGAGWAGPGIAQAFMGTGPALALCVHVAMGARSGEGRGGRCRSFSLRAMRRWRWHSGGVTCFSCSWARGWPCGWRWRRVRAGWTGRAGRCSGADWAG
ncbi:hypothetical protein RAA17_20210 [Komagataeibacter rhaeticus]|nr:hypothetical protein [Komagataeibacter rhaeticus]